MGGVRESGGWFVGSSAWSGQAESRGDFFYSIYRREGGEEHVNISTGRYCVAKQASSARKKNETMSKA